MNKIVAEGTFSNEIFSGVEFIDTGRESKVYDMLNGFLFFAEIPAEKNSNRQRVEKLYETLSEKGGLFGQDKKIIFEAYKNFMSGNSTNSQYILAESDVPPEIAKFANDPLAKQTFSVQFNNLLMQEMVTAASIAPDNVFQDEIRALKPFSNRIRSELLGENIPPVHTYREIEYDLQVPAVKMIEIPNSLGSDKLRALKSVCNTNVDLPLPETPVTQVKVPIGIFKSTFFKLLPLAPKISKNLPFFAVFLFFGTSIIFFPDK